MRQFLDLDRRFTIAHRGGSKRRPENTIAAFDYAAGLGVDAIELDVQLSRDGFAMVIHDLTLERTTNGAGRVADRTADDMARLDAGFHYSESGAFPYRGQGIGVSTLESVLRRYPDMPFMVELKTEAVAPAALEAVARTDARERVLFGSFDLAALQHVRRAGGFITSAATREVYAALIRSKFFIGPPRSHAYELFQVPEVRNGTRVVSRRFVRLARRAGMPVHVWTVDDADHARRLLGWGVTGFITDLPEVVMNLIGQRAEGTGQRQG